MKNRNRTQNYPFLKKKLLTLSAHVQDMVFVFFALVRCHGSMISIDFNRKVLFYMYKQYSNTFGLVKYIFDGNIKKRKVLRFFCGSVYICLCPFNFFFKKLEIVNANALQVSFSP